MFALAIYQDIFTQESSLKTMDKIIFITGKSFGANKTFISYVASLTNKTNPRICFIPTASGDDANVMVAWFTTCVELPVKPFVMKAFVTSSASQSSFEEFLLGMDAIIVGGGNTLNMLGIWKAQGIDTIIRKAYDKGIVLSGGSAGSLCWFTGGYSDSRPTELTIVEGLGFLDYSHCPHYNAEPARKPLFEQAILNGKLQPGYACDDFAGLLFVNGVFKKAVSLDTENRSYFVSRVDDKIVETELPGEIIT